MVLRSILAMLLMAQLIVPFTAQAESVRQVQSLKITALVTNVSGNLTKVMASGLSAQERGGAENGSSRCGRCGAVA
jgi:hypothetical protein